MDTRKRLSNHDREVKSQFDNNQKLTGILRQNTRYILYSLLSLLDYLTFFYFFYNIIMTEKFKSMNIFSTKLVSDQNLTDFFIN